MANQTAAYAHIRGGFADVTDDLWRVAYAAMVLAAVGATAVVLPLDFFSAETSFIARAGARFGLADEFVAGSFVVPILALFAVFDVIFVYAIGAEEPSVSGGIKAIASNGFGIAVWVTVFVLALGPLVASYPYPFALPFGVLDAEFSLYDLVRTVLPVAAITGVAATSFFVAPILVIESRSPAEAVHRNIELLRATRFETTVSVLVGVATLLDSLALVIFGVWLAVIGLATIIFGIGVFILPVALLLLLAGVVALPVTYAYARSLLLRTYLLGVRRVAEAGHDGTAGPETDKL